MTKDELLGCLENLVKNYVLGMVLAQVVTSEQLTAATARDIHFRDTAKNVRLQVQAQVLARNWSIAEEREAVVLEYENSLLRTLLREGHEAILHYCEETGQFPVYKAEPWFQFARITRNVVSHKDGGMLRNWPDDLSKAGIVSVTWRHKTLDTSMVGTAISFYPFEALDLFLDQLEFASSKLQ